MLVDLVQFGFHFDGKVNQITEVSIFINLGFQGVDSRCCHVGAADRFDLLDRSKFLVIKNLVKIN